MQSERRVRNSPRVPPFAAIMSAGARGHFAMQSRCPLWVKSRHVQRTSSCPLWARSGRSGGLQCAVSAPRYGVIQTVVAPKQLTVYNKRWRSKDVQSPRFVGVFIISAPDRFRVCVDDYAIGVLADLAQAF